MSEPTELYDFIEKCQKLQGMTFMAAFDLWLDLAPLRGAKVIERGSFTGDDDEPALPAKASKVKPAVNLPLAAPSELLTVRELCAYLQISRASLYRYGVPGKCKVGGQVRYVKQQVDEWLASSGLQLEPSP